MSTTALFIEYLVVGTQATIWLCLFVNFVAHFAGWTLELNETKCLSDWSFLVTMVIVGLVYTIGIAVERLAGAIFPVKTAISWLKRFRQLYRCREHVREHRENVARDLNAKQERDEHGLSRIRIVRAAIANTVIVYIMLILSYWSEAIPVDHPWIVTFWTTIAAFVVTAVFTATLIVLLLSYSLSVDFPET